MHQQPSHKRHGIGHQSTVPSQAFLTPPSSTALDAGCLGRHRNSLYGMPPSAFDGGVRASERKSLKSVVLSPTMALHMLCFCSDWARRHRACVQNAQLAVCPAPLHRGPCYEACVLLPTYFASVSFAAPYHCTCPHRPSAGEPNIQRWPEHVFFWGGGQGCVLESKGPQRRLDRRLEEGAHAVGGGYCRLQMPLKLALGVRETVAGLGRPGGRGGYDGVGHSPGPMVGRRAPTAAGAADLNAGSPQRWA